MSPKDPRRTLWYIVIVLLVFIIIAAALVIISNPPVEVVDYLSPDDVMENFDEYIGETITVEGYYYHENVPEGEGVITSSIVESGQSLTNYVRLPVNHSAVNISLADEVKYRFTGVLTYDPSVPIPIDAVLLVAEKIVRV